MINHIRAVVTQNESWRMVCGIAQNNAAYFVSKLRTEQMLSIILAAVTVIRVGLTIKGYNPDLNISSRKHFDPARSSQCSISILYSPHA